MSYQIISCKFVVQFRMDKIKKILPFIFVALFISYHASITLFSHTHTISGATIMHSHAHTDSHHDSNSGGHTQSEITLIAQISNFNYIDFSFNCVIKPIQLPLYGNKFIEITHRIISIHLLTLSLRAPPTVA